MVFRSQSYQILILKLEPGTLTPLGLILPQFMEVFGGLKEKEKVCTALCSAWHRENAYMASDGGAINLCVCVCFNKHFLEAFCLSVLP